MVAQFFLRDQPRYDFDRILPFIGTRRGKSYSLVRSRGADYVLSMAPTGSSVVPLSTDARRQALVSLLLAVQGPYVLPVVHGACLKDRSRLVVLRPWCPSGSLADLIYSTQPLKPALDKYPSQRLSARGPIRGTPLPERDVQRFGYQILQGIMWLKSVGLSLPHLHVGNVLIRDGNACLSELENGVLGFEPPCRRWLQPAQLEGAALANIEVVLFGHILFHMSTGFPLAADSPHEHAGLLSPAVYQVLSMIFPAADSAADAARFPKPRNVCAHPFFDTPRRALQPPAPAELQLQDKAAAALLRQMAECTGWLLAPHKFPKPVVADSPQQRHKGLVASSSSVGSVGSFSSAASSGSGTPQQQLSPQQPRRGSSSSSTAAAAVGTAGDGGSSGNASSSASKGSSSSRVASAAPPKSSNGGTARPSSAVSRDSGASGSSAPALKRESSSGDGSRHDLLADIRKLRKE